MRWRWPCATALLGCSARRLNPSVGSPSALRASPIVLAARTRPSFAPRLPPGRGIARADRGPGGVDPRKMRGGRRAGKARSHQTRGAFAHAWRLAARRPAFLLRRRAALCPWSCVVPPSAFGSRPLRVALPDSLGRAFAGPPSASSSRGPVVVPGGAPAPPECVLARHARGRRPDPHERRNRFASPQGVGRDGIWS